MASQALLKLEEARESLTFSSCGRQADGVKRSNPSWTLPKASRDDVKKVFVSKKMPQDLLGRGSPGHVYDPKRVRSTPSWSFGAGEARPHPGGVKYPDTSNDLTQVTPDSQPFKYGEPRAATIGTCPRDVISNAPDLNGFPKGRISPGPMRYNVANCPPATRLAHAPGCDMIPPKWSIGQKTVIQELKSQTGEKVGPGTYPIPDAVGKQHESDKKSNPSWSCNKKDRFPKKARQHDTGRLWDGEGKRAIQFNRTTSAPPSFSFGTSTRFHAQKIARCMAPLDERAKAEPANVRTPHIDRRREILKFTDVPKGC
mmetsp:Transcript_2717/g.4632  ORF Transcript_2717/g.4632 Transcript_2717/m.4632 type:complete len:313 (+) Transcript_2717:54-992(+)